MPRRAPAEKAPAKPAEKAPAKQAEQAPAKPAEKAPAKQAEQAPAKPAEKAPARQAEQAPKPAEKAPAAAAEKQATKPQDEAAPAKSGAASLRDKAEKARAAQEAAKPKQAEKPAPADQPGGTEQKPANSQAGAEQSGDQQSGQQVSPDDQAPVFDSQKEEARQPGGRDRQRQRDAENDGRNQPPPPKSDRDAQRQVRPEKMESVEAEQGKRVDRPRQRQEEPEGAKILKDLGERLIMELGGRTVVRSNDHQRLARDARDVYYEDLPHGRTRETILRPNGAKVVTIRDRYGDVVQRSRITPDGREYVLVYAGDRGSRRDHDDWRDPGRDLPPLRVDMPRREYVLDSGGVNDPDRYYQFLEQPPVEPVRQLYSVDDVKYSARIRDTVRRVDLENINFETGSAQITRNEVDELQGIASAMERMLDKNPAEMFLIEGHTDAVGSEDSNLALSDARAESVAEALTQAFGIPPENLVTQGYGEKYLKVDTQGPSRENRRVAIRRITPLVAPVASND